MPANRVVLLLTPLVAPVAGFVAAWLAKNLPGVEIDEKQLNEIFLAGLGIAFAGSAHWLHGYQKHEAREAEAARQADAASDAELEVAAEDRSVIAPELEEGLDDDDADLLDAAADPLLDDELDEDEDLALDAVGASSENGQ